MRRIGVLTSGGDAPGMNAAIRAVVRTAYARGMEVFGVERGFQGLVDGVFRPMGPRSVSSVINRGGTILRTARCKAFLAPEGRAEAAALLRQYEIEGLVVIGGDGSYRGAHALGVEHSMPCVGVPGTIDNDINGTDSTIGYDTALNTALEAIDRIRDTADSHDRLFFVEVMGRESGYLALMCGIAGGAEAVITPEDAPPIPELVKQLRAGRDAGKRSGIVVVAEGSPLGGAQAVADAVAAQSEFQDSRVVVAGHLQRGGVPTASDRILAARLGASAVDALLAGEADVMVGVSHNESVLSPLTTAWETERRYGKTWMDLSHLLAT